MLLFLLSVGLSVTLGMMNFVNLAHCSFAMLGGYVAVSVTNDLGWPFLVSLPVAFVAAAVASVAFERLLYRRLYRATDLDQCLLTIGIVFISVAVAAYVYGTIQQPLNVPSYLRGTVSVMGQSVGVYRLFLIGVSLLVTLLLVATLEYTRFGAQVRAAVDNQRMARGLGINVDRVFAITFALGSGLAGLGGALAVEIVGPRSRLRLYLSGLCPDRGCGRRARLDRRLVRRSDPPRHQRHGGQVLFPELGAFLIYFVMVTLLMWRPLGLFGRR
jgi:branched-chain amino acid transport system permease protein